MHITLTEHKQIHNTIISWNDNWILIFIFFVGRLLLEPSAWSSSSFITTLFLIQMIRWIRGSSRIESFIFLIVEGSSLNHESLIFSCSHLLFSYYELSILLCALFPESAESNHFLLEHIPRMNESSWSWEAIQGGYHNFCILYFFIHCFNFFFDLRDPCKLWLYGLCILQLIPQIRLLIYVLPFK